MSFKVVVSKAKRLRQQSFMAPWTGPDGERFRLTVRRIEDPSFVAWREEHVGGSSSKIQDYQEEAYAAILKEREERRAQAGLSTGSGGRQRKMTARRRRLAAELDEPITGSDLFRKAIELARADGVSLLGGDGSSLDAELDPECAQLRPGLIEHLVVMLEKVYPDGRSVEASPLEVDEFFAADPENVIPEAFDGPGAGLVAGDATTMWALDCAEWTEAFWDDWTQEATEDLSATPGGDFATGS